MYILSRVFCEPGSDPALPDWLLNPALQTFDFSIPSPLAQDPWRFSEAKHCAACCCRHPRSISVRSQKWHDSYFKVAFTTKFCKLSY
jgi:hypothetical protein